MYYSLPDSTSSRLKQWGWKIYNLPVLGSSILIQVRLTPSSIIELPSCCFIIDYIYEPIRSI